MSGHTDDDEQRGVGFFRGLLAVLRGLAHGAGMVVSGVGRLLSFVTRRSHDRPHRT